MPCLCIQRGCKCEKVSRGTAEKGSFGESRLSETPIVWRKTSVTFTRDDDDIRGPRERSKGCFDLRVCDG